MKVLMLGWEFPPHISGGLGTACLGISQGLAQNGVDVLFVVPRLHGDEPAGEVKLVSASDVELPVVNEQLEQDRVPVRMRHAFSGQRSTSESSDPSLEWRPVDSPLRPYMTEAEYVRKLEQVRSARRQQVQREREAEQEQVAEARATHIKHLREQTGEGRDERPAATRRVELTGGYGPDLVAEVERYAEVVRELSRREQFDVVHAHDWMTYPAGIAASEQSGKPLVLHVHACEIDRRGEHCNSGVRAVEQEGLKRADRVVCVSEYTANILKENYTVHPDKLHVVHNAVTRNEQREQLQVEKMIDAPVVLFLGRITYQKGPDYFLEAAARVLQVMPDVHFVLSGTGDMWHKMIERAAQLGIAANTHFTGFLRGSDVERMFAMADLYVMPSVSEPFGISSLEAMALDVPVIISRQSGVSEVLSNALKVDFWDVEDLANKILALLRYPALTDELSSSGRKEVERMSWKERGRSLLHIYEGCSP